MLNNRYSQHARRAINYANLLAGEQPQSLVDTTHVLIGILREEGSIGSGILHDLHMDLRRTERAFRQTQHPPIPVSLTTELSTRPDATPALSEALALAADESKWLGQHYIGTEHLLLGIARSNEAPLLALLHGLEISPEQIRRRVRRLLQDGITEISLEQAKRVARLSELSRRVLNAAEQLASQLGHPYVGLAHLLLVLAREQRSVCARMLRESQLDAAALELNLAKSRPALGGRLEDVIDRAVDRAESFGSHYTGTEHLLMSLILDQRGARLLHQYGVDAKALLSTMRAYLS